MKNPLGRLFSKRSVPKSETPIPMGGNAPKASHKKRRGPIGFIIAIVFVIGGILAGQRMIAQRANIIQRPEVIGTSSQKNEVAINRSFSFAAYDRNKKLSKKEIGYTITSAEKTDQIIIKGKRATAVNGRTFLIFNLKLNNPHDESLFLNTRNFVRVQPVGSEDKLAPEVHNDTVEIQPDSTKLTRVGMPVDKDQNTFTLFVGAVDDSKKEEIVVEF